MVERYEETVAAYERLGFERLLKGTARGTLFRAGPALVELVDGTQQQRAAGRRLPVRAVSRTRT